MSTTITNLPETSKVNDSDYLVLDQSDKTVKSTVSKFLADTGVVLATQLKDTDGADLIQSSNGNTVQEELNNNLLNDREQWRRSLAEAGLTLVDGSFEEGATVGSVTDAIWYMAGAQCYTWDGVLPKDVPPKSTPTSTGGVDSGAWVSVGDMSLKDNLSNSSNDNYGDALVAVKQPYTTAINRTQHDKNADVLDISDFGVDITGASDEGSKLQQIFNELAAAGKSIRMHGSVKTTINLDIRCNVLFEPGFKLTGVKLETGPQTYINIFNRNIDVSHIVLDGIVMCFYPVSSTTTVRNKRCITFTSNTLEDSCVRVGGDNLSVRNVLISNNTFKNSGSRVPTAIRLINVSNVEVSFNLIQEYGRPIYQTATRSFSNYNVNIHHNNVVCDYGIVLEGTTAFRVSKFTIADNDIVCEVRNTAAGGRDAIDVRYGTSGQILNNNIRTNGRNIRLSNTKADVLFNDMVSSATSAFSVLMASCYESSFIGNKVFNNSTAEIIVVHVQTEAGGLYTSNNVRIESNTIKGFGRLIRVLDTKDYVVTNNRLIRTSNNGNAVIVADGTSDRGQVHSNVVVGPAGVVVSSISGTNNATTTADTLLSVAANSKTVTAVANGLVDPDLNNSKAFIFNVQVSDVQMLRALSSTGASNAKTVSQFMARVSGATLAWNGTASVSEVGGPPDIFVNGVLQDSYGAEDYIFYRSGMLIDSQNKLSVRDFQCTGDGDTTDDGTGEMTLRNMAAAQAAEGAIHSAFFRSPLVMDGVIYNPDTTGIYKKSYFDTSLDPRMAIGQKADGTYVIICVNGRYADGVSPGCTMQQLASKFVALGCINAMNLDGGGSATLWYNGTILNTPSDGSERPVYHCMYV
ncbi:tail spike protein [Escherichia phage vB_EcoM_PHB05]|uniref:Tail fibers protein n=2 Tax=Escherichia phage vB_EcoM_PHB05 TaxID=2041347 RepID=A0A291LB83_9CAUD|nr:tail spike protein [Escherichia phage vB_EcoM_PHB05]ATI15877.1 tail fibers protein [Escherichia phage vB_EcoM_PHB05]